MGIFSHRLFRAKILRMTTHTMNLRKEPFNKIKNGTKIIESRLYDEKRQLTKVGDTIIFTCTEGQQLENITTTVQALFLYQNFTEMMSELPAKWFGHTKSQDAIDEINQFYSSNDQVKFGVVGIRISKVI